VLQPAPPAAPSSNPWSTRSHSQSYGSYQPQHWGQPQRSRPQSYTQQPAAGLQYRPLEQPQAVAPAPARPAPQPQMYYPAAPYNSLSGSSFDRFIPMAVRIPGNTARECTRYQVVFMRRVAYLVMVAGQGTTGNTVKIKQ
jgi:hypothetical protein